MAPKSKNLKKVVRKRKERKLVEQLAEQPHFKRAENVENQNILERLKTIFRG